MSNTPKQLFLYNIINLIFKNHGYNATDGMTDEVTNNIQILLNHIDKNFCIYGTITVDDYVNYKKKIHGISKDEVNINSTAIENMEKNFKNINNCKCIETCLYNDLVKKKMINYAVKTVSGVETYNTKMLNNAVTLHGNFEVKKNVSDNVFTVEGLEVMSQDHDLINTFHTIDDVIQKIKEKYNSLIMEKVELKNVNNQIISKKSRVSINNFNNENLISKKNSYKKDILKALLNDKEEKNDKYIHIINKDNKQIAIEIGKGEYDGLKQEEKILIQNANHYNKDNDNIKSNVKGTIFDRLGKLVNNQTNVFRLIKLIDLMPEECKCDGTSCRPEGLLCYREMFF